MSKIDCQANTHDRHRRNWQRLCDGAIGTIQNMTTDRLLGRDTAGNGAVEQLTVGGGIEFTGSGGIQTSAFTSDVTKPAGSTVLTIASDAVTFAKMQNIGTDTLIGRDTAGTGDPEAITVSGGLLFSGLQSIIVGAFTGDVTKTSGATVLTIAADAVTFAKMQNITTDRLVGRDTAGTGDPEEVSVTNGLEFTGGPAIGIAAQGVTFARMQNITTDRLLGRDTAATGSPEELTVGGGIEFTGSSGIQTSAFTGDVTKTAGGTALTIATNAVTTTKINDNAVTFAKFQSITDSRLLGRSGSAGNIHEITVGSGLTLSLGTLTATAGSPLTTKGDLHVYSTADTRLATGTTDVGLVLTPASSPVEGLAWKFPTSYGMATRTAAGNLANSTTDTVLVDANDVTASINKISTMHLFKFAGTISSANAGDTLTFNLETRAGGGGTTTILTATLTMAGTESAVPVFVEGSFSYYTNGGTQARAYIHGLFGTTPFIAVTTADVAVALADDAVLTAQWSAARVTNILNRVIAGGHSIHRADTL